MTNTELSPFRISSAAPAKAIVAAPHLYRSPIGESEIQPTGSALFRCYWLNPLLGEEQKLDSSWATHKKKTWNSLNSKT